jgi:hypothetical protein
MVAFLVLKTWKRSPYLQIINVNIAVVHKMNKGYRILYPGIFLVMLPWRSSAAWRTCLAINNVSS